MSILHGMFLFYFIFWNFLSPPIQLEYFLQKQLNFVTNSRTKFCSVSTKYTSSIFVNYVV